MTERLPILQIGRTAAGGPSAGLLRYAATELLLMLSLIVISLLACDAWSRTVFSPMALESTRLQPTEAVRLRAFHGEDANGANNDGYLEGLAKARDHNPD